MVAAQALVFDVFGTLVDWYTPIKRLAERIGAERSVPVDGDRLATSWRRRYRPAMDTVRSGARSWCNFDELHRGTLADVLAELDLDLAAPDRERLVAEWHRLEPWPDTVAGLAGLGARFITGTLSNGHMRMLVDLARHGGMRFDVIISAELAGTYKPDPSVYLTAARLLELPPDQVMLVACHPEDLAGAAAAGLRTAYVSRPAEWGPGGTARPAPDIADVAATDLIDLARRLPGA
ncbi:MAG TPA: haloacid dehalogenase type II [Streptosporangiaceae bacterium]|nr:haloacid dehalogenase type II [Streptosporangiaceae bacterium]